MKRNLTVMYGKKRKQKTFEQEHAEFVARRRNIKRGMKIALYEVEQLLNAQGVTLKLPPWFIPYTIGIAEGGRRDASPADRIDGLMWHSFQTTVEHMAALEARVRRCR